MLLFEFDSEAECNLWTPINDVVMGGISYSTFEYIGESCAVFSGTVSLKNSGGFASVRSTPSPHDLTEYNGITLRVRGDGKEYKMNLRTEATLDGVQYQAVFETQKNVWSEFVIPFSGFVPMFRGTRLPSAAGLDIGNICSFGFLISSRQEGVFRLEIDRIGVYG